MTGLCFVDANVIVYSRDPRDPAKQARAAAWLDHLWHTRTGRTSGQVIAETYSVLRRISGSTESWEYASRYFSWNPRMVDEEIMRSAIELERRHRLSWWDSLIVAAAQAQRCAVLLTEDLHDGAAFGTLIVRSPFSFAVEQSRGAYDLPAMAAAHRPRGRPRRAYA